MATVDWIDERSFRIGRVTFRTSITERFTSASDNFLLVKHRHMVERYQSLLETMRPRRMLELGICEGGSAAFLSLLAEPERFVVIDVKADPTTGLETFIVEHGLGERLRTYYGFDQADDPRLRQLVATEFGDAPLDLVIDDASHRLGPTRASFNVLFPRLRPGGLFVIEDWSGLHHVDEALQVRAETDPTLRAKLEAVVRMGQETDVPLSVLLFELILASAYAPAVFGEITVSDDWASVARGPGPVDPLTFDVSQVYSAAARTLIGRTA